MQLNNLFILKIMMLINQQKSGFIYQVEYILKMQKFLILFISLPYHKQYKIHYLLEIIVLMAIYSQQLFSNFMLILNYFVSCIIAHNNLIDIL
jgi:hypothetical protein